MAAQDSHWQAAKELARAAEAARQAGEWPDVAPLWRAAALAYATASRHPAAADALAKGALALEQHDPKVIGIGSCIGLEPLQKPLPIQVGEY